MKLSNKIKSIAEGIIILAICVMLLTLVAFIIMTELIHPFKDCEENNYTGNVTIKDKTFDCQAIKNITYSEVAA